MGVVHTWFKSSYDWPNTFWDMNVILQFGENLKYSKLCLKNAN